jgi:hypothetical protein
MGGGTGQFLGWGGLGIPGQNVFEAGLCDSISLLGACRARATMT